MRRLLFVHPFRLASSALERQWVTPYPPLGLLYLAATARRARFAVSVYDGTFRTSVADFAVELTREAPDVVCLGSLITTRPLALDVARQARSSGAWVIAGGPDPTVNPGAYLAPGAAHAVIRGEGEQTLLELLAALQNGTALQSIAGLALPGLAGQPVVTAERHPIADPDALPHPARDLVDIEQYFDAWRAAHGYTSLTLAATRGCPLGCDYCRTTAVGPHWRVRQPDSVAAEMKHLQDVYAPDRFRLVDDLDGLGPTWLRALATAMVRCGVTTPYEGLRLHQALGDLPLLVRTKELCADRNAWIPKAAEHPHAPPALEQDELQERWRDAALRPGVTLAEP